ncbi:hypothetical protein SSTU70S_01194 [Stutzerimonas stutzeri]
MHAALGFFAGQVLLQRRAAEAADAAEGVQLVGYAQRYVVAALDTRLAGRREVVRQALATATAARIDAGEQLGTLDAVQRAVGLDVQRGLTQVAVVLQRHADQLAQRGVAEELLPAQIGRARVALLRLIVGRALRPVGLDRRLRSLVLRDQTAAAQCQGNREGQRLELHAVSPSASATARGCLRPSNSLTTTT